MVSKIEPKILKNANRWLNGNYDRETKNTIQNMIENNPEELTESFHKTLEFGTGGLRGIMGVGTNRMNIYTVAMATQGFANYMHQAFSGEMSVAIAYDCRHNSSLFAKTTAAVFAANDIKVYLFDTLRPTPELSFAIRHLGCRGGVVITASHNPKEYNGYKAYWDDGAQVVAPHDTNIINEVNKIESINQVKLTGGERNVYIIGEDIDEAYLDMVADLSLSPEAVAKHNQMKIVYTPIHGTGVRMVPAALARYGFTNIVNVPEQEINDGDFPTVKSPNPEDPAAMKMAIDKANEVGADLVMATDPDSDRQAIAVRDFDGNLVLLNGNQCASILTYYLCRRWSDLGKINGKQYIVKTIVTSEMLGVIAKSFGVKYFDVLTGFKYIAEVIRDNEGVLEFIGGGEESFGYMVGDSVRDKDAVSALSIIAECAAWAAEQGTSLWGLLIGMYMEYGFYKESLVSITKKGINGTQEINQMMVEMRENPPRELCGSPVTEIRDYQTLKKRVNGIESDIKQAQSNVLQFITADGTIASVRPSGTEPKIKFYFGVKENMESITDFAKISTKINTKLKQLEKDLGL